MERSADHPVLASDLAGAIAQASVDPTLGSRALQDALRAAIATRRGFCAWDGDHTGWVVTLHSPEEQTIYGRPLEEGPGLMPGGADGAGAGAGHS